MTRLQGILMRCMQHWPNPNALVRRMKKLTTEIAARFLENCRLDGKLVEDCQVPTQRVMRQRRIHIEDCIGIMEQVLADYDAPLLNTIDQYSTEPIYVVPIVA